MTILQVMKVGSFGVRYFVCWGVLSGAPMPCGLVSFFFLLLRRPLPVRALKVRIAPELIA